MGNFRETIKIPTKEEKIKIMSSMFTKQIMCSFILSQAEQEEYLKECQNILSYEEATVAHELFKKLRILLEMPSNYAGIKNNVFEFLDISNNEINNKENLYKFVMAGVKDYEESKRSNPKIAWKLVIEKIINRIKEQEEKSNEKTENYNGRQ